MDWANLAGLLGDFAWQLAQPFIKGGLMIAGFAVVMWAIRLVLVQPKPERDEVGWTDQQRALLLAVPLVVLGLWLFSIGATGWAMP